MIGTRVGASEAPRDSHRTTAGPPRVEGLDILRGLTALAVMIHHTAHRDLWDFGPGYPFALAGERGVMVFFVLSGFLVTLPFFRGPVATGPFLVRRIARLMPAYLLAMAGATLLTADRTFLDHPVQFIFLLQNYDPRLFQAFLPASWTLVVEMSFYLLVPIATVAVIRMMPRSASITALAVVSLAVLSFAGFLFFKQEAYSRQTEMAAASLPVLIWAFIPGVILAWWVANRGDPSPSHKRSMTIAGTGLIAYGWTAGATFPMREIAILLLVIGTALIIPALLSTSTRVALPGGRGLAFFGLAISFPFYLWHMSIIDAVRDAGVTGPLGFLIALIVSIGVGLVSYRVVERPINGLASEWARRRATASLSVPASVDVGHAGSAAEPPMAGICSTQTSSVGTTIHGLESAPSVR